MKITVSRRQTVEFIPEGQDDVEEDKRLSLSLRPMSLAVEEELMDGVFAKQSKGEQYAGDASLFNRVFRTHVIGWKNAVYDDGTAIPFDKAWLKDGLPDDLVSGFDLMIRASAFTYLLDQAGMRTEDEVGKSE